MDDIDKKQPHFDGVHGYPPVPELNASDIRIKRR